MKLLVQSDDYGISRGVSAGILYGIRNGIIRNTGIFANMPWFEECAAWIETLRDDIALGIDLNISTGPSILSHETIPSITKQDGSFYSSSELRKKDKNEIDLLEAEKEFGAQIERFISFFGHSPDYVHPHAFFNEEILNVQRKLAKKYGSVLSGDVWDRMSCPGLDSQLMPWYIYPMTYENQLNCSLKDHILSGLKNWKKKEYAVIVCHAGYVDGKLMELSSFNLLRMKDLDAVTDREVIRCLESEGIESVTYKTSLI